MKEKNNTRRALALSNNPNDRFVLGCAAWVLFAVHLVAFIIIYVPSYVIEHNSTLLLYAVEFITRLYRFTVPVVTAALLFSTVSLRAGRLMLRAFLLSLTSLIYYLPYYYLVFLAQGNDSLESLLISLPVALGTALVLAILAILLSLVMRWLTVGSAKKAYLEKLPMAYREKPTKEMVREAKLEVLENLNVHLSEGHAADLSYPVTFAIFGASFVQFIVSLISEMVDIVIYLDGFKGDYRTEEIIYIALTLLFIFAELFIAHFAANLAKGLVVKHNSQATESEDEGNETDNTDEALGE